MNRRRKIQFEKLLIIIVVWLIIGLMLAVYDHISLNSDYSNGPSAIYSFTDALFYHLFAAFIGSLFGGSWLVFFVNEKLHDKPYYVSILAVLLSFFLIIAFIIFFLGFFYVPFILGAPLTTSKGWSIYYDYLFDFQHLKNIIVWLFVVILTQFILSMNDKFGHGLLLNFILGKYHTAKQERRIFMFLDIRSSTTIAEKLGNKKYYKLLRDFFGDITNDIVSNRGEIYQYVGDEIVISWKVKKGLENAHCIKCYFDMKFTITNRQHRYMKKYGIVPEFKVGMHIGDVTAGEIGIIKKDVTFSGDVLNTASRIQELCNTYKVDFLASSELLDLIEANETFKKLEIGSIELRGRKETVSLSTLTSNDDL